MSSLYKRGQMFWLSYQSNGKTACKSLKTTNEKLAKYRQNEFDNQVLTGQSPVISNTLSSAQVLEAYISASSGRKGQQTINNAKANIERFVKSEHIARLGQINEASLARHIAGLSDGKLSPGTKNTIIKHVKTFLNWAVKNDYIAENRIASMDRYRDQKRPPRYFTSEEIKALIPACDALEIGLFARIALYTGMRFSEIARMEWKDCDLCRLEIMVPRSKPGTFRTVPMHQELKSYLEKSHRKPKGALFQHQRTANTFYTFMLHRLARAVEMARLSKASLNDSFKDVDGWHTFRHTFASHLAMSGVDLNTIRELLGHARIATTMIYAHLTDRHIKQSIAKLPY